MSRRGAILAACAVGVLLVGLALGGLVNNDAVRPAAVELRPMEPGGPAGLASIGRVDGETVGPLAVWGLEPGSRHRVEVGVACGEEGLPAVDELVAGPNGVAFGRMRAPVISGGTVAVTVFSAAGEADGNPRVACGQGPLEAGGVPPEPLSPAELALVGPGEAARADVSVLVQLEGGEPVGGVQEIRAAPGDVVAFGVRSDVPDQVALDGLGVTVQAGPGVISRFSVRVQEAGRYPIRAASAGDEAVGVLVVDE
ncbi:MAG TPA: hypothetical protein VGW11_00950 [Solirubrobacteraceae bacterium]|nr:hypothetical protein [Solirubrobacteraceae bacterium]